MKLSQEMDVDNGSIPADAMKITKSSHLTSDESLKPHLSTQNGIKHPAENVTNGSTSFNNTPDMNLDENAIGFEVESYSDFNSSVSHGKFSPNKGETSVELNGNNNSSNNGDNRENDKILSDESCTESTHNSSHMSEEFQLRLSDDDSSQLSETASSSTPFKSLANDTKDEDGTNLAGSDTLQSSTLATEPIVNKNVSLDSKPNEDNEGDVHQLKCLGVKNLQTPCKDTHVEPGVQEKLLVNEIKKPSCPGHDGVNEETSLSTDLRSQTTDVLKENNDSAPSCQPEKCTKLLSIEDTLEAELEAELQAEIAAEMENKDKVKANKENISVIDMCTAISSDKNSDGKCLIQENSVVTDTRLDKSLDLLGEKELSNNLTEPCNIAISVIKTEKEDEIERELFSIKEEVSLKTEEMSLDCDDFPIKKEIDIKPLALKNESPVKIEPIALKSEESPFKCEILPSKSQERSIKIEECPVKKEGNVGGSGTEKLESESQAMVAISSVTSCKGDDSLTPCEHADKTSNESEDPGVMSSQESSKVNRLDAVSSEPAESEASKEDACEADEEQNKVVENEAPIPISDQQLDAPQCSNFPDEESRLHESEECASNEKEEIQTKNSDTLLNSPFSDDSDCPVSEFHAESDDVSENGDGILNENDSDTMCENDLMMTDEAESNEKSGPEGSRIPAVEKVSSSSLNDTNLSESSNFCDSTVLDATCTDDMVSQDPSNSTNNKGFRKRFLSHSEDDSCDTFRIKKPNGVVESEENSESRKDHNETSHKRPAEVALDIDSKKLRISGEVLPKEHEDKMGKEQNQIGLKDKLQTQAVENIEESVEELEKISDLARVENETQPTDLPFLRKLHKTQLSKMSRSDLEELILQKMCEAITERSVVGELRLRCQALEIRQEKENEKFNKLKKQMNELSIVMRKYMDNQRLHKPSPPIRVTRSVGLQVCPAVRSCTAACFSSIRTRGCQQSAQPINPINQNWPAKQNATPSKPDSSLPDTPSQVQQTKQVTPNKVNRTPPHGPRPASNVVTSTVPPGLVPTVSSNAVLLVPGRTAMTPPRVQVPPLQQISTVRPRLSVPSSIAATSPQPVISTQQKASPVRHGSPQSTTQQKAAGSSDVEVIDIENEDQSKRPAGLQISAQQHQHQQKQAANAAAQSLAGNSGMTVRLISPTQTIPNGFSNFLVPTQGNMPQKMIIASSPPGNGMRGNFKFVMKSNQGNVLIPLQSNGAPVSSSVVQIPASASAAVQQIFTNAGAGKRINTVPGRQNSLVHPAPLPVGPTLQAQNPAWKQIPPRPNLKIQHQNNGIVLSWNMALGSQYADIESYQLFAYQEGAAPPSAGLWKKVGDVKALPLPMACTLTQFVEGHRYHFTVRAVDKHGRVGPFSQQGSIRLGN